MHSQLMLEVKESPISERRVVIEKLDKTAKQTCSADTANGFIFSYSELKSTTALKQGSVTSSYTIFSDENAELFRDSGLGGHDLNTIMCRRKSANLFDTKNPMKSSASPSSSISSFSGTGMSHSRVGYNLNGSNNSLQHSTRSSCGDQSLKIIDLTLEEDSFSPGTTSSTGDLPLKTGKRHSATKRFSLNGSARNSPLRENPLNSQRLQTPPSELESDI